MRESSNEEADGRDGRLASPICVSRISDAGTEPAWSIICPLASTLVVSLNAEVNSFCVTEPFRGYPF